MIEVNCLHLVEPILKKYAGIGSRDTPKHICELMFNIGKHFSQHNWVLRSGHARGADRAFEDGCDAATFGRKKEIFKGNDSVDRAALDLAEKFHPAWHNCDADAMRLHARNGYIILGSNLDDPVEFVICYAPGRFEWGGTSQALRIAKHYNIPVINLFENDVYKNLKDVYDVKEWK